MGTRVITAHIPDTVAKKLDGLADKLERPRGWLVKEAITAYIALEEERYRQTREALAEVNAGRVIDNAEIEAWANALDAPAKRRRRA